MAVVTEIARLEHWIAWKRISRENPFLGSIQNRFVPGMGRCILVISWRVWWLCN